MPEDVMLRYDTRIYGLDIILRPLSCDLLIPGLFLLKKYPSVN